MRTNRITAFLLSVLLCLSFSVNAKVIKIATLSPDGTAWMKAMRTGADEIERRTQNRVKLKFYPGGVMGSDQSVLRKIRIGQLHGGAVTTGSLANIYPEIDIYGLPYLFSDQTQVDSVRTKLDSVLLDGLEEKGFIGFGIAGGGFTYMMSDDSIVSVEQARDKKIWIPSESEVGLAVFDAAGLSPVPLPLPDVLTGLQTGLIDTIFASPIGAIALQWHTKINYVVDLPLTYLGAMLVIDARTFNKLKPEDQVVVREVMEGVFEEIDAKNQTDNIAAREALQAKGVEFIQLPDKDMSEWLEIGKRAIMKLEEQNSYDRTIYRRLMETVRSAS